MATTTATLVQVGRGRDSHLSRVDGATLCGKTNNLTVLPEAMQVREASCDRCNGRARALRNFQATR